MKFINKVVILLVLLVLTMFVPKLSIAEAQGSSWTTCTPVNVAVFTSRIHVKCSSAVSNGILYFATSTQDSAHANRMLSVFTAAINGNRRLSILYKPSDTSGTSFGCQAHDCRISIAAAILR